MGVYGGTQQWAGSSRADKMTFTIAGQDVKGMVLQNVQFTFSQQISMLFEIGSGNVYYIGGRAQGQASIGQIIGPGKSQLDLINKFKDMCQPNTLDLGGKGGACEGGSGVSYSLKKAVLTSIGASVNSQDVQINQQLTFMFADMDVT